MSQSGRFKKQKVSCSKLLLRTCVVLGFIRGELVDRPTIDVAEKNVVLSPLRLFVQVALSCYTLEDNVSWLLAVFITFLS